MGRRNTSGDGNWCVVLQHTTMDKVYFVYIITNKPYGTLYIGVTGNLINRITQHREKAFEGLSKDYGLRRLVWFEDFGDVHAAIQREKTMKKWRRDWKINLIEQPNPLRNDLFPQSFAAASRRF
jgi:putative endonuclease